ncbi:MAG TPA: DUF6152 family protein [Steroidobacteraceae bacterium]|jgi:hypothetical protein|nr:DUF6152 family protein [Steroidobacteraceae bacterium]
MLSRFARLLFAAAVSFQMSAPAFAHHSVAMFDTQKQLTLSGTVRVFQFSNPHCFIQLLVPNGSELVEWNIEMASPAHLIRNGWNRNTIKAGDKLIISINPARAGGNDGRFLSATRDGTPIGAQP